MFVCVSYYVRVCVHPRICVCVLMNDMFKNTKEPNTVYHIYPTPPLGQDMTQGQFF